MQIWTELALILDTAQLCSVGAQCTGQMLRDMQQEVSKQRGVSPAKWHKSAWHPSLANCIIQNNAQPHSHIPTERYLEVSTCLAQFLWHFNNKSRNSSGTTQSQSLLSTDSKWSLLQSRASIASYHKKRPKKARQKSLSSQNSNAHSRWM